MTEDQSHTPLAYFITLTTYGTWLHGDHRGSVDRLWHHTFDTPRIAPNAKLYVCMQEETRYRTVVFNQHQRQIVMKAMQNTCHYYQWHLYAIHVRSNHVHIIVSAKDKPEKVMNQLKAYASRSLNQINPVKQKYWVRHGSTRYIWSESFLFPAMQYVIDQQGERMACYYESWYATA